MDASLLETYLHEHIPISAQMGVRVLVATASSIQLSAPLDLNINHHRTAFGGSISTLATLSAWSYVHALMKDRGVDGSLVIQRHEIDYLKPILGEFQAESFSPTREAIDRFFESIAARGKGRIEVQAEVIWNGATCARFKGQFVALTEPGRS